MGDVRTTAGPDVLHVIGVQQDHARVLQAAVDVTGELFPDGLAFAALPVEEGFRVAISRGATDPRFHHMVVRPGLGLGGYVLDHRHTAVVDDYETDPRITRHFVDVVSGGEGLKGIICVPVVVRGRVEGLLYGGSRRPGPIPPGVAERLERAAAFAAVGIEQAEERRQAVELQRLRERERLASMLHDSVAQMLFGIGVAARQSLVAGDATALEAAMREIETTAASARRELRDTLDGLADCEEGLALVARLHAELRLFSRRSGCHTRLACGGEVRELPDPVADLVVDVVLEGLRNAVRHAGATFALAFLDFEPQRLKLAVQCEVAGVRPAAREDLGSRGSGLLALAGRTRDLGGVLELHDGEGGLQVLRLQLPLQR